MAPPKGRCTLNETDYRTDLFELNYDRLAFSQTAFTEGHLAHLGNSLHGYISSRGALISLVMRSQEGVLRTVSRVHER